jgi:hypothetical protein
MCNAQLRDLNLPARLVGASAAPNFPQQETARSTVIRALYECPSLARNCVGNFGSSCVPAARRRSRATDLEFYFVALCGSIFRKVEAGRAIVIPVASAVPFFTVIATIFPSAR